MTVTVIVPTLGRTGLARALRSCEGADEIIVAIDGQGSTLHACDVAEQFGARYLIVSHGPHGKGYQQREVAIRYAEGTHLAFLDDDDVFAPGALDAMHNAAADVPVIFRMDHPLLGVLWNEPQLVFGNVGTPMMLIPNLPGKLGRWLPHFEGVGGDFTFLQETCELQGAPLWDKTITALVRPGWEATTPWV